MKIGRYAVVAALTAGVAIGLAGPANAEWTDGAYAYSDTDPDSPNPGQSLGNAWTRTEPPLPPSCTFTVDNDSLNVMSSCQGLSLQRQLTKNG